MKELSRWSTPREDRPLTPAETALLATVRTFLARRGYAPTVRELAALRRVTTNTVRERLDGLHAKGYLESKPRTPRTLTLTAKAQKEST